MKDVLSNKYLHKALMYDQLACYFKYIDPTKHMMYYQKHFAYMQQFIQSYREELAENTLRAMMAKTRIFHAATHVPEVDIYIDGRKAYQNIQFKQMSGYLRLSPGEYTFSIYQSGQTETPLFSKKISIQSGKTYTLTISGNELNLDLVAVVDQKYVPVGESRLRFFHLSPDTPAVDVAIRNGDVLFSNVEFKHITNYLRLSPMSVDLEVRKAGTNEVILLIPNVKLRQNSAMTIAIIGLSDGMPRLEPVILKP